MNTILAKPSNQYEMKSDIGQRSCVIDIFCGAGGLTNGLRLEEYRVAKGIEMDVACRYLFTKNNNVPYVQNCVSSIDADEINECFTDSEPKILVGCAPCRPFSKYSQNKNDSRWSLLDEFARLISESCPDIVSTKNVTSLPKFRNGSVFEQFLDDLRDVGYKVDWYMVYCPEYGVRQSRARRVLLATLTADPPQLEKTHIPSEFLL